MDAICAQIGKNFHISLKRMITVSLVYGIVESVDEKNKTATVVVDKDNYFSDISLDIVTSGGNSILCIPAIGSVAILGFVEGQPESAFIIQATKLDKVIISNEQSDKSIITINNDLTEIIRGNSTWKIENEKVSWEAGLTEINGGGNGGMVMINELTEALNSFVSSYNSHTHSNGNQGSPTGTPIVNAVEFIRSDYENTKIKQ